MDEPLPDGGVVRKLWIGETDAYRDHLLRLDRESRNRRFSGAVSNEFVTQHAASAGGFEGNFYEVAYGLNYKPAGNSNLILRPEIRYDWYDGRANALGNQPYDDGTDDSQFLYGFDAIYLY